MKEISLISQSSQETVNFARNLAGRLMVADILCLFGDLGAGKTTFVKGIAQGIKVKISEVNSPTFTLLNIYKGKIPLYHFDLYRLDNLNEIARLGYEEFFYSTGISIVEWADKLGALLPQEYLAIELIHRQENKRLITLKAYGRRYEDMIQGLIL